MVKSLRRIGIAFLALLIVLFFCPMSHAGGSASESYAIPTFVISGGGSSFGSSNFRVSGTLGQSSPLMDTGDPPYSDNYDLYPGYWYTLGAGVMVCDDLESFSWAYGSISGDENYNAGCDHDKDDDVDGMDLADFAMP